MTGAEEFEKEQERIIEGRRVEVQCPDCAARLAVESATPLPPDLKVVFVSHCN